MRIYTYIYKYMNIPKCMAIHKYWCIRIDVLLCMRIPIFVYTYIYKYTVTPKFTAIHKCTCMCIHVVLCMQSPHWTSRMFGGEYTCGCGQ